MPILVSPWPPSTAIRALRWRLAAGPSPPSGDSFEFGDQRDDAHLSFEVYSRFNVMPRRRLVLGPPTVASLAEAHQRR